MIQAPPRSAWIPALAGLALAWGSGPAAWAADWFFKVTNATGSAIVKLETREEGGRWGYFELESGIAPGQTARLEWDASTDTQDCIQMIRATFADGSVSEPARFDFCNDLDTPITFSE
jgi:hypothetical protein